MNSVYGEKWYRNILVYPEGKRYPNTIVNNIKIGTLSYSFEKKIPLQLILSKNKELFANENKLESNYGTNIITHYSEIIDPTKFDNETEFIDRVKEMWNTNIEKLYLCQDEKELKNIHLSNNVYKLKITNSFRYILLGCLGFLIYQFLKF